MLYFMYMLFIKHIVPDLNYVQLILLMFVISPVKHDAEQWLNMSSMLSFNVSYTVVLGVVTVGSGGPGSSYQNPIILCHIQN